MKLDLNRIAVREVLNVQAHPMRAGHYALRGKKRHSDCFLFVCNGAAFYTFEGYSFGVEKGDVFYLAYLSQYDIDVDENYEVAYIDCMLERPEGALYKSCHFPAAGGSEAERMMLQLERRWIPHSAVCRLSALSTLYHLFAMLAQQCAVGYLSSSSRQKMQRARDAIAQGHTDKDFSCAALCATLGLSEVHFRRLFSQFYGLTPNQLLTALRMRTAKSLLLRSNQSIAEVSHQAGYRSVYYFCRAFKRETGFTPTEYRKSAF